MKLMRHIIQRPWPVHRLQHWLYSIWKGGMLHRGLILQIFSDELWTLGYMSYFLNSISVLNSHDLFQKKRDWEEQLYQHEDGQGQVSDPQRMYLLPDIKYRPFGSTAKLVTASRWATIEWISLPLEKDIVIFTDGFLQFDHVPTSMLH